MYPPNIALLEEQIHEMGEQLRAKNHYWFTKRGIEVIDKAHCFLLRKIDLAEKNHWNILCNGLLLSTEGYIMSFPQIKLYDINEDENHLPEFDYTRCDFVKKIGGHMASVCWPWGNGCPWVHSLHGVSVCKEDITVGSTLGDIKKKIETQINLNGLGDTNKTLTFQYDRDQQLFLVHGIHLSSFHEYSEDELDNLAHSIHALRPLRTPCFNYPKAIEFLKKETDDYIIRDIRTGIRANASVPIDRPKVVSQLTWRRLVPYWIKEEHPHIIKKHPDSREKFAFIEDRVREKIKFLHDAATKWYTLTLPPKCLADSIRLSSTPTWAVRIIISMCKINPERWYDTALEEIRKMNTRGFMKAMEIGD